MNFACIVCEKCFVPVVDISPVSTLAASMCFPHVRRRTGAQHTVWSRTIQNTQNTGTKHANIVKLTIRLCIWR